MGEVRLTKAQRDLLRAIGNEGDGWFADIMRMHPKHSANVFLFRELGLVSFGTEDTRVRITPAGRAALNPDGEHHE